MKVSWLNINEHFNKYNLLAWLESLIDIVNVVGLIQMYGF
jgi:hypothetical protein